MTDSNETKHIDSDDLNALSVPDGTLQPGQVLQSRYRILGIIGMGGMGAVYQARDLNFANVTRLCAVKEMINLAQDPQLREQTIRNFEREAEILATLSHPAIPQIYDFFSFGDRAYVVMEFIQGRDLETLLNSTDKFLPIEQILSWAIELCDVLSYLHNHEPEPVVFRDMKPANVMIDHHKRVRLIDFGIAKTFQLGQPGTMIGTEGYSPPEQYKGIASPAGDIYALGATLHHLLTRRDPRLEPPFSFDQRPIQQFNPNVPDVLINIVSRTLNYDPQQRYATAEAMKQALEAAASLPASPAVIPQANHTTPPRQQPAQQLQTNIYPQEAVDRAAPVQRAVRGPSAKPIWAFKVEDSIRSTPLVHKDRVIFGAYDNNVWAINIADGTFGWKMATEGGIGSSPAYGSGTIYIGSSDRRLYAIDVKNGKRKWMYKTNGKIYSTPYLALGSIFVGSDDGYLYALKPGPVSAKEIWSYNIGTPIRSSAVVEEDRIYFGTDGGELYCLAADGSFVWRFQSRRRIMSTPLVKEGLVYIGSDDWYMYALDISQGFAVWRYRTKGPVVSSPKLDSGKLLFGSADGFIYAINSLSGREEWKYEVGEAVTSSPFVYGEAVYIGASDGALYALHIDSGDLLWRFQSDGPILSSPYVVNDVVYVGSEDQHIYALQA